MTLKEKMKIVELAEKEFEEEQFRLEVEREKDRLRNLSKRSFWDRILNMRIRIIVTED